MTIKFSSRFKKILASVYYNLTIEQYLQRFEGTKPLECWSITGREHIKYQDLECSCEKMEFNSRKRKINFNPHPKIVVAIKQSEEKLIKNDWIPCGYFNLYRKDIIDQMHNICGDDNFQAINVKIVNSNDKMEAFENTDYYVVHTFNVINAIDEEKASFRTRCDGSKAVTSTVFKENPWPKDLYIAVDYLSGALVFHPKLAKAMLPLDKAFFVTDDEMR